MASEARQLRRAAERLACKAARKQQLPETTRNPSAVSTGEPTVADNPSPATLVAASANTPSVHW